MILFLILIILVGIGLAGYLIYGGSKKENAHKDKEIISKFIVSVMKLHKSKCK